MSEMLCETIREDIEQLYVAFRTALLNMGFDEKSIKVLLFEQCRMGRVVDQFDGQESVTGRWLDDEGQIAHFIRFDNGSLFAELDVLLPSPEDDSLFVEAIEVWGQPDKLNIEPRYLAAL